MVKFKLGAECQEYLAMLALWLVVLGGMGRVVSCLLTKA